MRRRLLPKPVRRGRAGAEYGDLEQVEEAIRNQLAVLADIETRFEDECLRLDRSVVPTSMRVFSCDTCNGDGDNGARHMRRPSESFTSNSCV
jgi:hypothetical protein